MHLHLAISTSFSQFSSFFYNLHLHLAISSSFSHSLSLTSTPHDRSHNFPQFTMAHISSADFNGSVVTLKITFHPCFWIFSAKGFSKKALTPSLHNVCARAQEQADTEEVEGSGLIHSSSDTHRAPCSCFDDTLYYR